MLDNIELRLNLRETQIIAVVDSQFAHFSVLCNNALKMNFIKKTLTKTGSMVKSVTDGNSPTKLNKTFLHGYLLVDVRAARDLPNMEGWLSTLVTLLSSTRKCQNLIFKNYFMLRVLESYHLILQSLIQAMSLQRSLIQGTLNRGSVGWQMSTRFSCFLISCWYKEKIVFPVCLVFPI